MYHAALDIIDAETLRDIDFSQLSPEDAATVRNSRGYRAEDLLLSGLSLDVVSQMIGSREVAERVEGELRGLEPRPRPGLPGSR